MRLLRTIASAFAVLVMGQLSACGGTAADGAAGELRLGYFPNITHAPALVGVEKGIFAEKLAGVKLSTSTFNAGPAAIEALFSGAIDATYIGPNPAINGWAQSQGKALHIIAGSTSGGAGMVVKQGITSVAELKGKKVASPQLGNTQDVALRYWLKKNGLRTDAQGGGDVSILPTANSDIITAFGNGDLDGAFVPEPFLSRLVLEHGGKVLLDEKAEWERTGGQFVTTHLIVRTEFLTGNPDVVRKLLEGHLAAVGYLNDSRAEAEKAANRHLAALAGKPLPDRVVTASFDNLTFTADPIAASLYDSAKHAEEVGLLKPVDLNGIYRLEILNELLRAAGKPEITVTAAGAKP